jgi:hypothetical protein
MFQLNGNPISIDSEQIVNGIRYPHLRDPALREQLGIVEVADPENFDQRFYWGVGNPKDLEGLKSQWTAQAKQTAGSMLAQTDWMIVRKAERNIDVPTAVAAKRAAIVAECDRLEAAIAGCADVEALIVVIGNQNWGE